MVGEAGFEPATTCFQGTYADQAALLPVVEPPIGFEPHLPFTRGLLLPLSYRRLVALLGFEPRAWSFKGSRVADYTTGLWTCSLGSRVHVTASLPPIVSQVVLPCHLATRRATIGTRLKRSLVVASYCPSTDWLPRLDSNQEPTVSETAVLPLHHEALSPVSPGRQAWLGRLSLWQGYQDLNPEREGLESSALPLSYTPKWWAGQDLNL